MLRSLRGFVGSTLAIGALIVACSEPKQKGGLMLAVDTDMNAPKDVNVIGMVITVDGVVKYSYLGRVTPEGKVLLPATVALTEPPNPDAVVRIRLIAFRETRARVLRDVRTKVPTGGRIALLHVALKFVDDGSAKSGALPAGTLPSDEEDLDKPIGGPGNGAGGSADSIDFYATFESACDAAHDQTSIDGKCQDSFVDSSTLPEYHEENVGKADDPATCFDVKKTFSSATVVRDIDRETCAVPLDGAPASQVNFAIVTNDVGACIRSGECYVPIDEGDGGWIEDAGRAKLPASACTLLAKEGHRLAEAIGLPSKHANNTICATPKEDETPPIADAGPEDASVPDASVDANDGGIPPVVRLPAGVVGFGFGGNHRFVVAAGKVVWTDGISIFAAFVDGSPAIKVLDRIYDDAGVKQFTGDLAVTGDGATVYFNDGNGFWSCPVASGCPGGPTALGTMTGARLRASNEALYAMTYPPDGGAGAVTRCTFPCNGTFAPIVSGVTGDHLDAVTTGAGDVVAWTDGLVGGQGGRLTNAVHVWSEAASAEHVVEQMPIDPMNDSYYGVTLDTDGANVTWLVYSPSDGGTGYSLERHATSPANTSLPTVLAAGIPFDPAGASIVPPIAVAGGWAYWIDYDGAAIWSVPVAGGASSMVATQVNAAGLVSDGLNVFWDDGMGFHHFPSPQ